MHLYASRVVLYLCISSEIAELQCSGVSLASTRALSSSVAWIAEFRDAP